GFHHISTGDVLRDHIKRGTELGKVAEGYIKQGQLIPDELMIDILGSVLDDNAEAASKGVIFDGFPRTIPQAQALSEMMKKRGSDIHAVVGLEVEDDELVDRLLKRGQMSGRSDDNLETINQRLKVYHSQTSPLRDYYLKEGKYNAIHGMGSIDDIFESIKKVVDAVK
ncbi:MAG: adenylate kinase, partial [Muribaculum sp.]|nr:adenylate kinase [Muribaculum sp.]